MVNDQYIVAKRIKNMELGIVGKFSEITSQALRDGVKELLSSKDIKKNCLRMSKLFRESNRLSLVAETLEAISMRQKEERTDHQFFNTSN